MNYPGCYDSLDHVDLKTPPNSIPAEQSVLGGLMLDNRAWELIADKVNEKDFYHRSHQLIFSTIAKLANQNCPYDILTISEAMAEMDASNEVGGLAYIGTLAKDTPHSANIEAYANIVRERSILRQLIHVSVEISNSAFQTEGQQVEDILDRAEQKIFEISKLGKNTHYRIETMKCLLQKAISKIKEMHVSGSHITGVSTGFQELDQKTSGLQPSDLILIAGRPSSGKTALAMAIAQQVALNTDMPIAVFSLEMPKQSLVLRMLSSQGLIDQQKVRSGQLEGDDWQRLIDVTPQLAEAKILIDDTPSLTPTELRSRARRLTSEHGQLALIVIDYLQLMHAPNSGTNRNLEISDISRNLKALAKELNVPVIALSQLNRNLEQRPNKRPLMSDLRDSGAIEQDADLILFVYRDEVYHEDSPDKGIAEIIIGKQRNGPIGSVRLRFESEYVRFCDLVDYE